MQSYCYIVWVEWEAGENYGEVSLGPVFELVLPASFLLDNFLVAPCRACKGDVYIMMFVII